MKLKNNWDESSSKRKATSFLTEELGASTLIARRASLKHGAQTEVRVKADPFKALSDIKGCSFHHIDKIAARLKKSPDDPRDSARPCASRYNASHNPVVTYMTWPTLKDHSRKLLGSSGALIPDDVFIEAAKTARNCGDIFVFQNFSNGEFGAKTPIASLAQWNDETHIFHGSLHECEKSIADDLLRRLSRPKFKVDEARVAKWLELTAREKESWGQPGLSQKQLDFLNVALISPCVALTGGPGTGKTFATHVIVRLMRAMGKTVVMCAPTGRAAQRMAEISNANRSMTNPLQSSTIHRLLEFKDFSSQGDSQNDADSNGTGDDISSAAVDDSNALSFKGVFARNRANPLIATWWLSTRHPC